MPVDTKLNSLVINKLTTAQYQELVDNNEINENELYLTTDNSYPTEQEMNLALAGKQDVISDLDHYLKDNKNNIITADGFSIKNTNSNGRIDQYLYERTEAGSDGSQILLRANNGSKTTQMSFSSDIYNNQCENSIFSLNSDLVLETSSSSYNIKVPTTDGTVQQAAVNVAYLNSQLLNKQDNLTAGTGIDITNNVISSTQTSVEWGNITGTLGDQTDLQNELNAKLDSTTAALTYATQTALSGKADSATSLSGYGITDAYTKTEVNAELNKKQNILTAGNNITIVEETSNIEGDTTKYYSYYSGNTVDDGNGNYVILQGLGVSNKYLRTSSNFGGSYSLSQFTDPLSTSLTGLKLKFKLKELPVVDDTFSSIVGGAYATFPKTNIKISYNVTNDIITFTNEYYGSSGDSASVMGTYVITDASSKLLNQWHTLNLYKDNNVWHINVDDLGTETVYNSGLNLGVTSWSYFFICNAYQANNNQSETNGYFIYDINLLGTGIYRDNNLVLKLTTDGNVTDTIISATVPNYTAGTGMSIVGNVISTTATTLHKISNTTVQVSDFVSDNTYTGYSYRADVTVNGITANDYPTVIFSPEDSISNNFARFVESGNGYVSIWCKQIPESSITIPTITYE